MSNATIIKGPHLLYVGANGRKTFGITVQSNTSEEGKLQSWEINDSTLIKDAHNGHDYMHYLGLTHGEYEILIEDISLLMINQ